MQDLPRQVNRSATETQISNSPLSSRSHFVATACRLLGGLPTLLSHANAPPRSFATLGLGIHRARTCRLHSPRPKSRRRPAAPCSRSKKRPQRPAPLKGPARPRLGVRHPDLEGPVPIRPRSEASSSSTSEHYETVLGRRIPVCSELSLAAGEAATGRDQDRPVHGHVHAGHRASLRQR